MYNEQFNKTSVIHLYTVNGSLSSISIFQFSTCHLFVLSLNVKLFDPQIGPDQVLPLRVRVDQRAIAMKRYSTFPKSLALLGLSIRYFNVISSPLVARGVLPHCRDVVVDFYNSTQLG